MTGGHVLRRANRYRDAIDLVRVGRSGLTWSAAVMRGCDWDRGTVRLAVWWVPDAGRLAIVPDPLGYRPVADHGSWKLHGSRITAWLREEGIPLGAWPATVVDGALHVRIDTAAPAPTGPSGD